MEIGRRTYSPNESVDVADSHTSAFYGNSIDEEKASPQDYLQYFKMGREKAGKFFEHPVVKHSYEHNQDIAAKLGIQLPDRPDDIAQVVRRPLPLK